MCVQTQLSWCASFGMLFTMLMHAEYLLEAPTISILVLIYRTNMYIQRRNEGQQRSAVLSVHYVS